jgi:hypothetical protein
MSREITIPAQQLVQEIQSLKESPLDKEIQIIVGNIDEHGNFIVPQQFKIYYIRDEMYIELNSANPVWNPNKPAGTYFNSDLWHFIDLLNQA